MLPFIPRTIPQDACDAADHKPGSLLHPQLQGPSRQAKVPSASTSAPGEGAAGATAALARQQQHCPDANSTPDSWVQDPQPHTTPPALIFAQGRTFTGEARGFMGEKRAQRCRGLKQPCAVCPTASCGAQLCSWHPGAGSRGPSSAHGHPGSGDGCVHTATQLHVGHAGGNDVTVLSSWGPVRLNSPYPPHGQRGKASK